MNREDIERIVQDAVMEEELTGSEIPAIDLYVDQIINLVADKLQKGSERYRDRQLTKTMINNYSKDGLITPIKGKKYNKEQVIQILTVYTLKNTLSIGQIKRMLDGAYAAEGFDGAALTAIYDRHLEIKRENRKVTEEVVEMLRQRNGLTSDSEEDMMLTVSAMLSLSGFLRAAAQAMIDEAYPLPPEELEKEKTKKEKSKAPKEKEKSKAKEKTKAKAKEKAPKEKEKKKKDTEERE